MNKLLLFLCTCCFLFGCSSRWFEKQPLNDMTVTIAMDDKTAYSKGVLCAQKLIKRPTYNILFTFNSDFTKSFVSDFILDKDLQTDFYATLTFHANKGKATIDLGKFYQVNRDHLNLHYGSDFYGNQYDYYKPKVDEFMESFVTCVK